VSLEGCPLPLGGLGVGVKMIVNGPGAGDVDVDELDVKADITVLVVVSTAVKRALPQEAVYESGTVE
jgi:hypothetical protein